MSATKHFDLQLTEAEADALFHLVNNGWDDGRYADMRLTASESATYHRTVNKVFKLQREDPS